MPRQDIPALTGLRGAAALWVAAYHLLLPAGFVTGAAAAILGRGYLAVDLFFVLSGFVMALTYGPLFRPGFDRQVVAGFLLRRLARLYPLYGLIVGFRFAYTALRYGGFDLPRPWIAAPLVQPAWDIPVNLLMVQAWGLAGSSLGTAWSISTEWGAYFLFPGLAALVLWRGRRAAWVAMGGAAALIAAVAILDAAGGYHAGLLDAWDGLSAGPMMRCLGGFVLGMGVWRVSRRATVARMAGSWAFGAAMGTGLASCIAAGAPDLAIYPFFPGLVLALACRPQRSLWSLPALVWLGEISYALYLLHIFLLHPLDVTRAGARTVLPPGLADVVAPCAVFALLLAASDLCFRRIERPGRALMMRWGTRLIQPRQSEVPVVNLTANRQDAARPAPGMMIRG
jgi:peptidoglycan/LPS O-acetylase OafA/YrhL